MPFVKTEVNIGTDYTVETVDPDWLKQGVRSPKHLMLDPDQFEQMLINLARHSDHHCVASRRYQSLELPAPAPQLPAGYGAMFLLALVPPLWFRVMDPRVIAARQVNASAWFGLRRVA